MNGDVPSVTAAANHKEHKYRTATACYLVTQITDGILHLTILGRSEKALSYPDKLLRNCVQARITINIFIYLRDRAQLASSK